MYESTLVKMVSLWYGSNRPALSGRAATIPPAKAARVKRAGTIRPEY